MKKITKFAAAAALTASALSMNANAHVVGVGYLAQANGDVTFYANHYHGNHTNAPGTLLVNGNNYAWDGYVHDTNVSDLGLDQYEYNGYGSFALNIEDWFTATVSGLTDGAYTAITNSNHYMDAWYPSNGPVSLNINVIEQNVTEPASLALLGLGLAGLGVVRLRQSKA